MMSSPYVLAVAVVLCGTAWFAVWWREAVPLPTPPPVEDIHPVVADLLMHRGRALCADAVRTTALSLADEGWLGKEERPDGTVVLRWDPRSHGRRIPRPHERLVRRRVRQRADDRTGELPLAALGPGDGDAYTTWLRDFQQAVRDEAVAQGLVRLDRAGGARRIAWTCSVLLAAAAAYASFPALPQGAFALLVPPLVLPFLRLPRSRPRLTPGGRRAARWWRRRRAGGHRHRRRHTAGHEAVAALPHRASRRIWSRAGGEWHTTETEPLDGTPASLPHQVHVLAVVACAGGVLGAVYAHGPLRTSLAALPFLVLLPMSAGWLRDRRRRRRFPSDLTFRGVVISRFTLRQELDEYPTVHIVRCCSVEDPATRHAWTFKTDESVVVQPPVRGPHTDEFTVGDLVEVHCDPRRRRLHRLTPIAPAAGPADPPPVAPARARGRGRRSRRR